MGIWKMRAKTWKTIISIVFPISMILSLIVIYTIRAQGLYWFEGSILLHWAGFLLFNIMLLTGFTVLWSGKLWASDTTLGSLGIDLTYASIGRPRWIFLLRRYRTYLDEEGFIVGPYAFYYGALSLLLAVFYLTLIFYSLYPISKNHLSYMIALEPVIFLIYLLIMRKYLHDKKNRVKKKIAKLRTKLESTRPYKPTLLVEKSNEYARGVKLCNQCGTPYVPNRRKLICSKCGAKLRNKPSAR